MPLTPMTLPEPDWRRLAAELVLHFHKTPSQASRICACSIASVQQCVAEYLRQEKVAATEPAFVPVAIVDVEESVPPSTVTAIPLDILTPGGLTLRFQLSSVNDVARLLQSLEADRC